MNSGNVQTGTDKKRSRHTLNTNTNSCQQLLPFTPLTSPIRESDSGGPNTQKAAQRDAKTAKYLSVTGLLDKWFEVRTYLAPEFPRRNLGKASLEE
ncbi:hypothetical protein PIB30_060575 [Stylosanthes scabra]|uniref:Uncharacterized protein n=1 Tax=Stylosanthes scabra TaxID=79078 RepID=A0ABU6WKI5_9FABA|nr:hypothetical protein [Stylosanthes scabra]